MKKITLALIGAGARGALAYAPYLLQNPLEAELVAVAEPIKERREAVAERFGLDAAHCFETDEELLSQPKLCDALLICTQDGDHYRAAIAAMRKGYDILLEKPMSNSLEECREIARTARETGRRVIVCHVLRYTDFFRRVKSILDSGAIGEIVSVQHNENVGAFHQAHSFVRGNWNNSGTTSPMILAKCCHDMDLLSWLIGRRCVKLSSFGSLTHFTPENAPEGSTERCLDGCRAKDNCPYYVMRYLHGRNRAFMTLVGALGDTSDEGFLAAIQHSDYGRCVYHSNNNVVDHQVVGLEYENGITVAFTMCAFTQKTDRTMKIMGTKGELLGHMERNDIKVVDFLTGTEQSYKLDENGAGHGGGDFGIMRDFLAALRGETASVSLSTAEDSLHSHEICFAAEASRLSGKVMEL